MSKIPYSPLTPDTGDLLRACQDGLAQADLSDRQRLQALASLAVIEQESDTAQQALAAWGVAAGIGRQVPATYGATPSEHRAHVAEWPAESLIDALNAIIGEG